MDVIERARRAASQWRRWSLFLAFVLVMILTRNHFWLFAVLSAAIYLVAVAWLSPQGGRSSRPPYASDRDDVAKLHAINELAERRKLGAVSAAEFDAELARILKT